MLWLIILLSVIALIAFVLLVTLVPRVTVEIHFKNYILNILIRSPIFKKKLKFDFSERSESGGEKGSDSEGSSEKSDFKDKFDSIKQRIFNRETGFDFDELRNVFDELTETYSTLKEIVTKILGKLRYRIYIPYLRLKLEYGTDNPANTGIIYGSIWSAIGAVYPILTNYFDIEYPILDITPDFYNKHFDAEVESIIKVRPAHIINAAFAGLFGPALTYFKDKYIKGREKNG